MAADLVRQLESELANINQQLCVLEERRNGIKQVLATYDGGSATSSPSSLTTIEMARQVLEQNGAPMGTSEIRREIQRKFISSPASSLQQMLFMRARGGRVFYNEDKKYGLVAWRKNKK